MVNKADKNTARSQTSHAECAARFRGTAACPRLNVFRSSKQHLCPDHRRCERVLRCAAASTLDKEFTGNGGNKEAAREGRQDDRKACSRKRNHRGRF